MKEENAAYLQRHPELRTLMDQFMEAALAQKPADIVKFAVNFFTKLRDPEAIYGAALRFLCTFSILDCSSC